MIENLAQERVSDPQRRAEAVFRLIVARTSEASESSPVGTLSLSPRGTVSEANDAFLTMVGYSREDLVAGKLCLDEMTPAEYREEDKRAVEQLKRFGMCRPYEKHYIRKDGTTVPVLFSMTLMEGSPDSCVALALDLTDLRRTEKELRQSEAKYRSLVENIPAITFISAPDGANRYVSPQVETMLGFSPEEWLADPELWLKQVHPEDRSRARTDMVRCHTTGRSISSEYRILTKDGRILWNAVKLVVVRDNDGNHQFVQGIALDITERKQAQKALEESEERFRRLVENACDMIIATDLQGNITEINSAGEELLGYSRQEASTLHIMDLISPEHRQQVLGMRKCEPAGEAAPPQELEILRKDGRKVPVELSSRPVVHDGRHVGFEGIGRDITERKRMEERLRKAQKIEAVGQLTARIAHDFNNLFAVIGGHSELVLSQTEPENPIYGNLESIKKAADRAVLLTRQLLAFSRRQMLQPKLLDLNTIVSDTRKVLQRLVGDNIELVTLLSGGLRLVKADPVQIEQVLVNLAANARDAMPGGGKLFVETSNSEMSSDHAFRPMPMKPGRYVQLAVRDTGCGMTQELQARVFEPFFTTKRKGEGVGLGLSTVYGIVKQSGGYIYVYSEPYHGTTFRIYFPCVGARSDLKDSSDVLEGRETVILVEDDQDLRDLASTMLAAKGYRLLTASNAAEALELSKQSNEPIDLLISDVVMPQMSGPELAERLRLTHPKIRVLFMSSYTEETALRHGMFAAGMGFLQKPVTLLSLAHKIRDILDTNR